MQTVIAIGEGKDGKYLDPPSKGYDPSEKEGAGGAGCPAVLGGEDTKDGGQGAAIKSPSERKGAGGAGRLVALGGGEEIDGGQGATA